MTRLQDLYRDSIVPGLMTRFGYDTVMQVPRVEKITLNMGVGEAVGDKKILEHAVDNMRLISGQKPIVTNARRSVAGFKIREGWAVGCKVTLRRGRMYEFLDRLINIAIPRTRDFRGYSTNGVRWSWKLQPWHQRADCVSGDRLRQDRRYSRDGCGDYNLGKH